ncbi:MAG: hypothetical protein ACRC1M_02680, partial [Methanobacteriaceae archaeon]
KGVKMAEYSESGSIIISILLGIMLSFLFDNIFVLAFIGFLATYMVKEDKKSFLIGIEAAVIFAALNFIVGLIRGPTIPSNIAVKIGIDPISLIIGFLVTCILAGLIGGFSGFIAYKSYKRINPEYNTQN